MEAGRWAGEHYYYIGSFKKGKHDLTALLWKACDSDIIQVSGKAVFEQ